jgi:hypothetical protein
VRRRESAGAARALAIGAGLTITTAGYAIGKTGRSAVPHPNPLGELA